MKKIGLLILISTIYLATYGQKKTSLSDRLWERVQPCYAMFEDSDKDGRLDYDELIDDSENGYLKVAGSYPTCGCYCENTVGAYKNSFNKYVFLQKNVWACSWEIEISSSDSLNYLFPIDFEKDIFFRKDTVSNQQHATFYFDIEIPQKGTDTKVTIKTIPFGLNIKSSKRIVFGFSEDYGNNTDENVFGISRILNKIENKETLEYILNDQFDKISIHDLKYVNKSIGDNKDKFKNKDALIESLLTLKRKYDLYSQIKHQWLMLGWDPNKSSFYIKEKADAVKPISFYQFLKNTRFWSPAC